MQINNILITGRLYAAFEKAMVAGMNKHIRYLAEKDVSKEDIRWADAYVGFRPTGNFEFGKLKWVHSLGAGVDSFLFKREWEKHVVLTRTICSFGQKISEYCLSYMLQNLQYHNKFKQAQKSGSWIPIEPQMLKSQRVVVFGTGSVGQQVARSLIYFGAKVSGVSLSGNYREDFIQVVKPSQLDHILTDADWLINTLPLTVETEKFFNRQVFSPLDNACFINVGRGLSVNENDLLMALDKKNLRFAVLDVFEEEPLPKKSVLWGHPNITVTPHISAITSIEEAVDGFLLTLNRLEAGETLPNVVNTNRGY